jgi:hypothetical protein
MAKVEARNELESYLYNARNSLQDEKVKEKLDAVKPPASAAGVSAKRSRMCS